MIWEKISFEGDEAFLINRKTHDPKKYAGGVIIIVIYFLTDVLGLNIEPR